MAAGVYGQMNSGGWGGVAGSSSSHLGSHLMKDPGQFPGVDRLPLHAPVSMQHAPVRECLCHLPLL
jgi:hypothetical protein